jgi:septum site-determining protein MinC
MAAALSTSRSAALPAPYTLRTAALTMVAVVLSTADVRELAERLAARPVDPQLDQDPVALDLSKLREQAAPIDFEALLALLRGHGLRPIAVRGGHPEQMEAARAAGLFEVPESVAAAFERQEPSAATAAPDPAEPPGASAAAAEPALQAAAAPPSPPERRTLVVDRPLRSGQQVYARHSDLIVLSVVNHGAEVIADGHIHVYAPLRGRAIAGARGDASARVFTTCMEPQLVAIAGTYRTTESPWPENVWSKPAVVRLEGDRIVVEPIGS